MVTDTVHAPVAADDGMLKVAVMCELLTRDKLVPTIFGCPDICRFTAVGVVVNPVPVIVHVRVWFRSA